jgi:2-keto-4-pentenoate hydratase
MTKRGTGFKKGEAFTTGSYAGVVELDFDKNTDIDYAGVGSFKVVFKELF